MESGNLDDIETLDFETLKTLEAYLDLLKTEHTSIKEEQQVQAQLELDFSADVEMEEADNDRMVNTIPCYDPVMEPYGTLCST